MCPLRLAALLALAPLAGAVPLDEFTTADTRWNDPAATLAPKFLERGFRWTSAAADTLRATSGGPVAGLATGETLVRLNPKSGRVAAIEILLYSRGDNGPLDDKAFEAQIAEATRAITAASGVKKPEDIKRARDSAVRANARVWTAKSVVWHLEWSRAKDTKTPEFLRLTLRPAGDARALLAAMRDGGGPVKPPAYSAAAHLETTPDGDKWLKDVPMVDQGQKGYCAVAATERVLRLYGLAVDEHELAQLAQSQADTGTSARDLLDALKKNATRLGVRPRVIIEWDAKFFEDFAKDYNIAAKKEKQPLLPLPSKNQSAFVAAFTDQVQSSPLRLAGRKTNKSEIKKFAREIASAIDQGRPLLWAVTLGLVEEKPALPQTTGGHMRLIIGYNTKAGTLLYSDSWGKGHERKTMPLDDAFAITNTLVVLTP